MTDVLSDTLPEDVEDLVAELLRAGPVSQRILKARLSGTPPDRSGDLIESLGGAVAAFEGESAGVPRA